MSDRTVYITDFDRKRLEELLVVALQYMSSSHDRESLEVLAREVERGKSVEATAVGPDVITMNSKVRLLDPEADKHVSSELVFPSDANMSERRVSVLAPLGSAMLGESVGNVITFNAPGGPRKFIVDAILYQPEAAGDYDR